MALHDQIPPPREENRLPSPSGSADAQSDHSDDEQDSTARFEEEFEEPDLPAARINSPPDEQPPQCQEQARIIDQGTGVWHFAPKGITCPQILDHENISDNEREIILKQCSKRLLRCLRHEVAGCSIAMQPGGGSQSKKLPEDHRENSTNTIRRTQRETYVLCFLEFANQGILPDSFEPYPRIQVECVQRR